MKDRFSKAVEELPERNAFICDTCGSETVKTLKTEVSTDVEPRETKPHGEGLHVRGLDIGLTRKEEIITSDPTPFGA